MRPHQNTNATRRAPYILDVNVHRQSFLSRCRHLDRPAAAPREDGGRRLRWAVVGLIALSLAACSGNKQPVTASAEQQLKFGVDMAQRGLWDEALFRFEQAQRLDPDNARILNNLAIAQESLGKFDEALATYKQALKVDPNDVTIKKNYTRFSQFYESFKPRKDNGEKATEQAGGSSEPTPEENQPPEQRPEKGRHDEMASK